MTFEEMKLKADSFFDFPTADRDHVTTTSAILFAMACMTECQTEALAEINRLQELDEYNTEIIICGGRKIAEIEEKVKRLNGMVAQSS